jgi:hypothetical protein
MKLKYEILCSQLLLSPDQNLFWCVGMHTRRSQGPHGLRRGYAAARLLGL